MAGIRITEPLDAMGNEFPECHQQLIDVMALLEGHYHDMCDIEFTIEQGRLFILQTRVGKRTAAAALRMAVEMEGEGLIDQREAVLRVQPEQLDQLLHPQFDPNATYQVLAKGLNASPGAAVGKVYFTADDAEAAAAEGEHRDPRPARDVARGPARHDRGRGHPHVARRPRVARGRRRARHGHAGDLRRRRARHRPRPPGVPRHRRPRGRRRGVVDHDHGAPRRGHLDQRQHRRGRRRRGAGGDARAGRSVRDRARLGRRLPHDEGAHQRRPARGRGQGPRVRRRGHRALPHRAHVPRRPAADRAEDDPRRDRGGGGGRARGAPRPAAHRLRRHPRGDGRPAGHGAAARPAAARVPAPPRRDPRPPGRRVHQRHQRPRGRQAHARAAPVGGGEPDARHPRVPARHPEAGPLPDAGAGAARGGRRPQAGRRRPAGRDHDPAHRRAHRDGAARRLGARGGREGLRRRGRRASTTSSAR